MILLTVIAISALALLAGFALTVASDRLPAGEEALEDKVNDLLPQTQCAQCGYPGCRPYARAVVEDEVPINLCPPGGEATVERLAELLGRPVIPLEQAAPEVRTVAIIDESLCIGCLHCRNACPVDAIIGAHQLMHTIIESECTGCELCVAPCPVDCITMKATA